MSQKLDYETPPPRDPKPLSVQIWNAFAIAAAGIVAIDWLLEVCLVAMPRRFQWTVNIAAIFLLIWLLNKYFFRPMREGMHQAGRSSRKNRKV